VVNASAVAPNGVVWLDPIKEPLLKNETFVTVPPPLSDALADMDTFAGVAKTALFAGLVIDTVGNARTVTLTTTDVAETPAAVATAVSAYGPAAKLLAVIPKGDVWLEPNSKPLPKNETFVTVPLLTEALAEMVTSAGAAKVAPLEGLVMETVGVGGVTTAEGVERV
jgi:hypothetical protein